MTATTPSTEGSPDTGTIKRGLSWATIAHVSSQVLWYGSLLLLVGLVAPSEFGTVALALSVVFTASAVLEAGGTGSLIASRRVTAAGVRRTVATNLGVAIVLTAGMALLAPTLVESFAPGGEVDPVRALSLCFLFTGIGIAPLALMQKALLFRRVALVRVVATATAAITGIVLGLADAGVWALVARQLIFQGLLGALAWVAAFRVLPRGGRATRVEEPDETRDARWFALLAVGAIMLLSIDNLIVGALTSAEELGLYSFAFTLGLAPLTQVSWVIGGVLFAAAAASEAHTVARRTVTATRYTALALVPVAAPAVVLAPVLIPAVVGDEWEGSVLAFQVLLLSGILHAVINVVGESLGAVGQIRWRSIATVGFAALTLVGVYVLTKSDGIDGAAIAHLVVMVPFTIVFCTIGVRRVGSTPGELWRGVRVLVVGAVVQAAIVVAVRVALDGAGDDVAGLAAGAVGLVAGVVLVLRAGPISLPRRGRR